MKKTENDARFRAARKSGEQTAIEYGFTDLPVDPFVIAEKAELIVQAKPDTSGGVSGMLLRHGENYGILYATHISSEGFQRFSVAHELGHYFLPGHIDQVLPPGQEIHTSHAGYFSGDPFEKEADHFAAGLLMPSYLFQKSIGQVKDGLEGIIALSERCKTSRTATAIQYIQFTDCPSAIIVSQGNAIEYCFMSEALKAHKDELTWLKKGDYLPSESLTYRFNQNQENVKSSVNESSDTELTDWLGGTRSFTGSEEVIGLGSYGKTLTVITFPDLPDEAELEEEDSFEESLTPRFRR